MLCVCVCVTDTTGPVCCVCVCADMEEAFAEYKEWLGGSVDAEVEKAYNRALDTLQKIRPFEDQLVRVLWACI